MRKLICILLVLFCVRSANAQFGMGVSDTYNDAKSAFPSSPNATQFQKYGDIPVNFSSGVPNISVPLWTIKMKEFSWPLDLSYHSIGNQVGEVASNVGLGWVLNAGGMISSKVVADNDLTKAMEGETIKRTLEVGTTVDCQPANSTDFNLAAGFTNVNKNGLPDIFYFNTPTQNNKFFLRGDIGYCTPKSSLKIVYNRPPLPSQTGSWQVTDDRGNKYYFEIKGSMSNTSKCFPSGGFEWNFESIVYYITKIVTYSGEQLDFYYTAESFDYQLPDRETRYENIMTGCQECVGKTIPDQTCESKFLANEQRLDSIKSSTGEFISFSYSSRTDLPGSSKIDRIKIYSFSGIYKRFIREYVFQNGYFGSGSLSTDFRLKLSEVENYGADGIKQGSYKFTYDANNLPSRLSKNVDLFGYYNGPVGNTTLIPISSNRTSSATYAKANILTKIEYPTGGFTTFDYELNPVKGGNRILRMSDYSAIGVLPKIRKFEYQAASTMTRLFYQDFANYYQKSTLPNCGSTREYNANSICLFIYGCDFRRHSSTPFGYSYDTYMTYPKYDLVREKNGENGEQGQIEYVFDYPKTSTGSQRPGEILGLEPQLVEKRTYDYNGGTPRIILNEKTVYELLPAQSGYFTEATDTREKNNWGIEIKKMRAGYTADCDATVHDCVAAIYAQGDFKLISTPMYLKSQETIQNSFQGGSTQTMSSKIDFEYNDLANLVASRVTATNSNGKQQIENRIFATSYSGYSGLTTTEQSALNNLVSQNRISDPFYVESKVNTQVTSKSFASYETIGSKSLARKILNYPTGGTEFKQVLNTQFDSKGNVQEFVGSDGVKAAVLYDDFSNEVTAVATNASLGQIAFTSFESSGLGGWTVSPGGTFLANNIIAGVKSFSGAINKTVPAGNYIVTLWANASISVNSQAGSNPIRTVGSWNLYKWKLTNVTSIQVTGDNYDEVRLFPEGAQMNTFTYEQLRGISCKTDPNGNSIFYEYDNFGRLMLERDQDKNIVKKYCYNIYGQTENCNIIYNQAASGNYTRTNCPTGHTGGSVTYSVPAGMYSGPTQAVANSMASSELALNGQAYANSIGPCTPNPMTITGVNTRSSNYNVKFTNNGTSAVYTFAIPANTIGAITLGTVPYGTYSVQFFPGGTPLTCTFSIAGFSMTINGGYTFTNVNIFSAQQATVN